MLQTKKAFCTFFLLLFIHGSGQNVFSAGLSTAVFKGYCPGLEVTPYVSFQHNKHEVLGGPEIYNASPLFTGLIVGGELEYRYHFLQGKHWGLYGDCNVSYVRYAIGPVWPVPFHYHNRSPQDYFSAIQIRSFNNTFGVGVTYCFGKRFALYSGYGIGYNLYKNNITPGIDTTYVNERPTNDKHEFSYRIKIGLSVKILTKDQQ